MLTRKKPETLASILNIKGLGEEFDIAVVYNNHSTKDVEDWVTANPDKPLPLFLLKHWDSEYPLTEEGIKEAEADRPGLVLAIAQGFYQARVVAIKGN